MGLDERRALLALCGIRGIRWDLIAREAQRPGGLDRLLRGELSESSASAQAAVQLLEQHLPQLEVQLERVEHELGQAQEVGADLVTVLDEGFPRNLRLIFNLPPFLFVRGTLVLDDDRSVAVVGTREATPEGLRRAGRMARLLVEHGVTVVSGLARGIDTAAHDSALAANGRTIAVLGTGIAARCYPPENARLLEQIVLSGAVVSQFWPTRNPGRDTFPRRNVVTSGISQGTVVIEASRTSGAKMQARLALEHGKQVFLPRSLVDTQEWARKYATRPGAVQVDAVEDVVRNLIAPEQVAARIGERQQLALDFA